MMESIYPFIAFCTSWLYRGRFLKIPPTFLRSIFVREGDGNRGKEPRLEIGWHQRPHREKMLSNVNLGPIG